MIRITIHHTDCDLMFELEGSLAGAWVAELEACWRDARLIRQGRRVRVDVRGLCRVDARGRELMSRLYDDGAEFLASGCVMPELLREIAAAAVRRTVNERIRS